MIKEDSNKIYTIQHVDRVVRAAEFNEEKELHVTGVPWLTLQGEGPLAGRVAWFVRLAGCNFGDKGTSAKGPHQCQFCDSFFKIDEANKFDPLVLLSTIIEDSKYDRRQILVITGGEPTLQAKTLWHFMKAAAPYFSQLQIETNGTQAAFFKYADSDESADGKIARDLTTIVISPKASEITGKYSPIARTVLWSSLSSIVLKFLISDEDECYKEVPDWALAFSKSDDAPEVYVSPIAVYKKPYVGEISSAWDHDLIDPVKTSKNYSYAAAYAIKHGLRLSIQQHLFCAIA